MSRGVGSWRAAGVGGGFGGAGAVGVRRAHWPPVIDRGLKFFGWLGGGRGRVGAESAAELVDDFEADVVEEFDKGGVC